MSETLSGVYKFKPVQYMYMYVCVCVCVCIWRYVRHNSTHAYVMCNVGGVRPLTLIFLYVPAVSNAVSTGNGTGTKNVLKWNRAPWFVYFVCVLVSCLRRYFHSESKPILYLDMVYCMFSLHVCVEIDHVNKLR